VIKGARSKVERYRSLGLMVADRNLPLEAVTDIERMRETVELVITQAKENGKEAAKANTAMVLLEEATASRSNLARDSYDAQRWKNEVADSREQLANSRSVITNAIDGTTSPNSAPVQTVAVNNPAPQTNIPASGSSQVPSYQPLVQKTADSRPVNAPPVVPANNSGNKPSDTAVATNNKPVVSEPVKKEEPAKPIVVQNPPRENPEAVKQAPTANGTGKAEAPKTDAARSEGPMDIGSLKEYATKQTLPSYPAAAKSMRTTGIVKVELVINESGDVAEVQSTSGPVLLQSAAKDAARKWKFKPFTRDGQPVRATGFVNFNFSL
jgi:periplasmic protein TonB